MNTTLPRPPPLSDLPDLQHKYACLFTADFNDCPLDDNVPAMENIEESADSRP